MSAALAWVGVGALGALGAWLRFALAAAITARRPSDFPFGTFTVNLSGGLALGVLNGAGISGDALLLFGTGLLGAYTTFSTWMVEAQRLGEDARWGLMQVYLLGSMAAGLATTGLGWLLAEALA
jgi:CrcB protein